MIQFNLLPDIKQQYLKAQRQKHLVVFVSTVVIIVALSVFIILLLVVGVWQKKSMSDLNGDIKKYNNQLSSTKDLDKILTVQNQLKSLSPLHDKKPAASRLFDYLGQVTPTKASISKFDINYEDNTLSINGTADSLETVNTFVDTLKFTEYTITDGVGKNPNGKTAFSKVVLANFGRSDKTTTYNITASFDPIIFSQSSQVELTVPQKTTTRSTTQQPTDLFTQSPSTNTSNQ
jgi:Tfp pilus assembly protein PilN